jgi:magnesium transporter
MAGDSRKLLKKTGKPPGTLDHVGEKKSEKIKITVTRYGPEECEEKVVETVDDAIRSTEKPGVVWINVDGLHKPEVIERFGKHFNIDYMVLEDILDTGQNPKVDEYEDYICVILKMLTFDTERCKVLSEQFSIIFGRNYVLTFQEAEGDVLDPVRKRIRNPTSRFRRSAADYLAYAIVDTIVDHYFVVSDLIKDRLDDMEEDLLADSSMANIQELHILKRDLVLLRKNAWPLREMVNSLEKSDSPLIADPTQKYLRDVRDHVTQVIDAVESVRDLLSSLQEIQLNLTSNRMNEIMKVLTLIATIFIPLTFIAGLYGMNFELMPELSWPWGYPAALLIMACVGLFMFLFFKRKHWI